MVSFLGEPKKTNLNLLKKENKNTRKKKEEQVSITQRKKMNLGKIEQSRKKKKKKKKKNQLGGRREKLDWIGQTEGVRGKKRRRSAYRWKGKGQSKIKPNAATVDRKKKKKGIREKMTLW